MGSRWYEVSFDKYANLIVWRNRLIVEVYYTTGIASLVTRVLQFD